MDNTYDLDMADKDSNKFIDSKILTNARKYEERPWGKFVAIFAKEVVFSPEKSKNEALVMKVITVYPGQKLSYQRHMFREEHWQIISGEGLVTINDTDSPCEPGDIIEIGIQDWHRIANTSESENLVFHEIITGKFDEHDIERKDDQYGRGSDWTNK